MVHQWGVPKVEALQLQRAIAALMRELGPRLGDLHWKESVGQGQESKALTAEAQAMLEAGRVAKRMREPGWCGEKGQARWRAKALLHWAAKELAVSRRGVELEFGDLQDWSRREEAERKMGDSLLKWLGVAKPPTLRVRLRGW